MSIEIPKSRSNIESLSPVLAFMGFWYVPSREPPLLKAIERWEHALAVLDGMDEHQRIKHFDMTTWGFRNDCGTIACLAGHCSLDPWFREQGFTSKFDLRSGDSSIWFDGIDTEEFFGELGERTIFLQTRLNWEQTREKVEDYLKWLKENGPEIQKLREAQPEGALVEV